MEPSSQTTLTVPGNAINVSTTATLAAAALATITAGFPAVGQVMDAKAEAIDANYNFDRFQAIT